MGRIILSICGAVAAGLLVGAAPPPNDRAQAEQAEATRDLTNAVEALSRNIAEQGKTGQAPELERPCEPGQDSRSSDLCAQWKAADSADRAAFWAMLGFWSGIVTTFALGLTIWQSHQSLARASQANETAKDAIANDMRPWLSVQCSSAGFVRNVSAQGAESFFMEVDAVIKNCGRAPATSVRFNAEVRLSNAENSPESLTKAFCDRWITGGGMSHILFGGETPITSGAMVSLTRADIDADMATRDFKMISPVVICCVSYRSAYFSGVRQTRLCYMLTRLAENGQTMVVDPTRADWWTDRIMLVDTPLIAEAD